MTTTRQFLSLALLLNDIDLINRTIEDPSAELDFWAVTTASKLTAFQLIARNYTGPSVTLQKTLLALYRKMKAQKPELDPMDLTVIDDDNRQLTVQEYLKENRGIGDLLREAQTETENTETPAPTQEAASALYKNLKKIPPGQRDVAEGSIRPNKHPERWWYETLASSASEQELAAALVAAEREGDAKDQWAYGRLIAIIEKKIADREFTADHFGQLKQEEETKAKERAQALCRSRTDQIVEQTPTAKKAAICTAIVGGGVAAFSTAGLLGYGLAAGITAKSLVAVAAAITAAAPVIWPIIVAGVGLAAIAGISYGIYVMHKRASARAVTQEAGYTALPESAPASIQKGPAAGRQSAISSVTARASASSQAAAQAPAIA